MNDKIFERLMDGVENLFEGGLWPTLTPDQRSKQLDMVCNEIAGIDYATYGKELVLRVRLMEGSNA